VYFGKDEKISCDHCTGTKVYAGRIGKIYPRRVLLFKKIILHFKTAVCN